MIDSLNIKDAIHLLYLLKQLDDIGRIDIIRSYLEEEMDYDIFYELLNEIIYCVFEYSDTRYYEYYETEIATFSDRVVVEFYQLADEYGKHHHFDESKNPYLLATKEEYSSNFSFSYNIDWNIQAHPNSKRPFHSRFALFIYHGDYFDMCGVAIGIVRMYQFYLDNCKELKNILYGQEVVVE